MRASCGKTVMRAAMIPPAHARVGECPRAWCGGVVSQLGGAAAGPTTNLACIYRKAPGRSRSSRPAANCSIQRRQRRGAGSGAALTRQTCIAARGQYDLRSPITTPACASIPTPPRSTPAAAMPGAASATMNARWPIMMRRSSSTTIMRGLSNRAMFMSDRRDYDRAIRL